jgi:hypothetical protein
MNGIAPQSKEQRPANLETLRKQLEELAEKRSKQSSDFQRPQAKAVGAVALLIRGR